MLTPVVSVAGCKVSDPRPLSVCILRMNQRNSSPRRSLMSDQQHPSDYGYDQLLRQLQQQRQQQQQRGEQSSLLQRLNLLQSLSAPPVPLPPPPDLSFLSLQSTALEQIRQQRAHELAAAMRANHTSQMLGGGLLALQRPLAEQAVLFGSPTLTSTSKTPASPASKKPRLTRRRTSFPLPSKKLDRPALISYQLAHARLGHLRMRDELFRRRIARGQIKIEGETRSVIERYRRMQRFSSTQILI